MRRTTPLFKATIHCFMSHVLDDDNSVLFEFNRSVDGWRAGDQRATVQRRWNPSGTRVQEGSRGVAIEVASLQSLRTGPGELRLGV